MAKTLIANLGVPGNPVAFPAALTHLEIDGEPVPGIQVLIVDIDASLGGPAEFTLRLVRFIDGLEYTADETHAISNISLIIEYQQEA